MKNYRSPHDIRLQVWLQPHSSAYAAEAAPTALGRNDDQGRKAF
jgi:hypothetical protein